MSFFNSEKLLLSLEGDALGSTLKTEAILNFRKGLNEISDYCAEEFLHLLQEKKILDRPTDEYFFDDIITALKAMPQHKKLITELLNILISRNLILMPQKNIYKPNKIFSNESLSLRKEELFHKYPEIREIFIFLNHLVKNYLSILSGEKKLLDFLFPQGSFEIADILYRNNPESSYYNTLVALLIGYIVECFIAKKQRKFVNILEIGAGTGSTTVDVLRYLNSDSVGEYLYTDISFGFLSYGQKKFRDGFKFMNFSKFDLNQPVEIQDLERGKYDIIFATNAIHNAHNIKDTLMEIKKLLSQDGIFILNEGVSKNNFSTLIYGLVPSWWEHSDADLRIKNFPLLSTANWKTILALSSFKEVFSLNELLNTNNILEQDIIVAHNI